MTLIVDIVRDSYIQFVTYICWEQERGIIVGNSKGGNECVTLTVDVVRDSYKNSSWLIYVGQERGVVVGNSQEVKMSVWLSL